MSTLGNPESISRYQFLTSAQNHFAVLGNEATIFAIKDTVCRSKVRREKLDPDDPGGRSTEFYEFQITNGQVSAFVVCEKLEKLFVGSRTGEVSQFSLESNAVEHLYRQSGAPELTCCLVVDEFLIFGGDGHQALVIDCNKQVVSPVTVRNRRVLSVKAAKVHSDFPMSDRKTFVFMCGTSESILDNRSNLFVLDKNYAAQQQPEKDDLMTSINASTLDSIRSATPGLSGMLASRNKYSLEEIEIDVEHSLSRQNATDLSQKDREISQLKAQIDQMRQESICDVCGQVQSQRDFLANIFDNQLKLTVLGSKRMRFSRLQGQINKYGYYCSSFGAFLRK